MNINKHKELISINIIHIHNIRNFTTFLLNILYIEINLNGISMI
jgi:hypothetical protein